jgi:hypothetical protein
MKHLCRSILDEKFHKGVPSIILYNGVNVKMRRSQYKNKTRHEDWMLIERVQKSLECTKINLHSICNGEWT